MTPHAPLVLAAHGSRDPRSAATMAKLARRVRARWPAPVVAAFLDFNAPSIPDSLRVLAPGAPTAVVVPLLLTSAYHDRVDLPAVLGASPVPSRLAPVLGPAEPGQAPDPLLLAALRRRLSELDVGCAPADGVVLIAAGTSHAPARSTVDAVAAALSAELNVACVAGYASASIPTAADAVRAVRARGARRIVVASYFLATGRLYEAAAASAREAGAIGVAAPIGDADELVNLVLARARQATVDWRLADVAA